LSRLVRLDVQWNIGKDATTPKLETGGAAMNRNSLWTIGIAAVWLVVSGGLAISAQDKYTVKVPGGLAFSEFKGYEAWQAISMSRNDRVVAMILGNPVMIDAYRAGIPSKLVIASGN
jgi:hypothetical protein